MNLQDQVTNLELSKRLKELGVKQNSFFHWYISKRSGYSFILESKTCNYVVDSQDTYDIYSALTASEIFSMFPQDIYVRKRFNDYLAYTHNHNIPDDFQTEIGTLPDCLAKMLIYLIENSLIEV